MHSTDFGTFHSLIVKKNVYTNFGISLSDADVRLTIKTSIFQSLNTDEGF